MLERTRSWQLLDVHTVYQVLHFAELFNAFTARQSPLKVHLYLPILLFTRLVDRNVCIVRLCLPEILEVVVVDFGGNKSSKSYFAFVFISLWRGLGGCSELHYFNPTLIDWIGIWDLKTDEAIIAHHMDRMLNDWSSGSVAREKCISSDNLLDGLELRFCLRFKNCRCLGLEHLLGRHKGRLVWTWLVGFLVDRRHVHFKKRLDADCAEIEMQRVSLIKVWSFPCWCYW